jgi:hypothetical protein
MRRGDFERAWAVSDRILAERRARGDFDYAQPRHCQTIWDGRPLARKHVLIRCYHGLGDTVMFIRFANRLRAIAREVSVWAQPPLLPLIATMKDVDRVLPLHDGTPDLEYDLDIEVMELAHALRVTRAELGSSVPFLSAPEPPILLPRAERFRVGVIWAAGDWAPQRSMRLADLEPLMRLPQVSLYSLQRGSARLQAKEFPIPDIGSDDVETFSATLRAIDLFISVDTFGPHLAGAMGLPVWVLLHRNCDWRWMESGSATPWYPSMRLFRQRHEGDWRSVVEDVASALATALAQPDSAAGEQSHPFHVRPV